MLWVCLVWHFTFHLNPDQHTVDIGKGGAKNPEKIADVVYGCPYLWQCMAGIRTLSYETIGKM